MHLCTHTPTQKHSGAHLPINQLPAIWHPFKGLFCLPFWRRQKETYCGLHFLTSPDQAHVGLTCLSLPWILVHELRLWGVGHWIRQNIIVVMHTQGPGFRIEVTLTVGSRWWQGGCITQFCYTDLAYHTGHDRDILGVYNFFWLTYECVQGQWLTKR